MSQNSLGLMILLACLKFCWRILNFAGMVFEIKVTPAKDLCQQHSAGACQKIPSLDNINPIFLLARQSHHTPRIVTVLVLLLVGIVRVHNLYLNPKICKYQFFSTDIL
jgi:hypothetical protein